ncbi:MAG: hypothetical protein GXY81_02960 [Candidatus Cloacimonetes bacterium]|nr:hypothetical protein [Candidatus Cloacimonadota bacterium]
MKHNLGFKLLALVLAIFIWLQLTLVSQQRTNTALKLKLVNINEEDTAKQPPDKISCTVAGRGLDILRLKFSKTHIEMDAGDYWASNWNNYRVVDPSHNLKVEILGVSPRVQALETKTRKGSASGTTTAEKPQTGGASGKEEQQSRVLRDLPISVPPGKTVYPSTVTIKVKGPQSRLASLPSGVSIHISDQADASGFYSLEVKLPSGISLLEYTPTRVRADK